MKHLCIKCKNEKEVDPKLWGETPENAVSLACNYCDKCEDDNDDFWEEWWEDENGDPI